MKPLNSRLFRAYATDGSVVLTTHLLARGSLTLAALIAARNFPPDDFAAYSYFQITISTIALFFSFGLGTTAATHFARFSSAESNTFPLGALWITNAALAVAGAAIVLAVPFSWLTPDHHVSAIWYSAGVLVTVLHIVPAGAIIGLKLYRKSLATSAAGCIVLLAGLTISATTNSPDAAFAAFLASITLVCAGDTAAVISHVGYAQIRPSFIPLWKSFASIAGFAGPLFLASLCNTSALWLTARIMRDAPPAPLAFASYSIELQWVALVTFIPSIITKISLPLLITSEPDISRTAVLRSGVFISALTSSLASCALVGVSPWLAELYGQTYDLDIKLTSLFMLSATVAAPTNILGNALIIRNLTGTWLIFTAASSLGMVVTAFLTSAHGAIGGAAAHLTGSAILLLLSTWAIKRLA
jgi:O-antigen/teichoic acid export membrane protein